MKSAALLLSIAFLGLSSAAGAANINVTTAAVAGACFTPGGDPCTNFNGGDCTLQDALDVAECNDQGDTINIAAGTYDADAANIFQYFASDGENFPLDLIGADGAIIDGLDNEEGMELNTVFAGGDDAANLSVSNIVFTRGNFSGPGGGLAVNITDADVTVDGCSFIANFSDEWGGGLYVSAFGESVQFFSNNLFLDNIANFDDGGGLFAESGQESITAVNNILAGNTSNEGAGGGIFLSASIGDITVINNTLFANVATNGEGGGLALSVDDSGSVFQIYNNIAYGNTAGINGDDIWTCEQGATVNLFNNDFIEYFSEGLDGDTCGGAPTLNQGSNISDDPLFVNSGADDFHLTATSPARDTGDPAAPAMPTSDFDGNPRPAIPGTNPDIGALEFQPIPTPTPTPTPTPPIPTPTPTPSPTALPGTTQGGCLASLSGAGESRAWAQGMLFLAPALLYYFRRRRFPTSAR